MSFPWVCNSLSSLLPLHGESSDDLTNISQLAHGVSLKFLEVFLFFSVANDKQVQTKSQTAHSNLTLWVIRWAVGEYGVSSHLHWDSLTNCTAEVSPKQECHKDLFFRNHFFLWYKSHNRNGVIRKEDIDMMRIQANLYNIAEHYKICLNLLVHYLFSGMLWQHYMQLTATSTNNASTHTKAVPTQKT